MVVVARPRQRLTTAYVPIVPGPKLKSVEPRPLTFSALSIASASPRFGGVTLTPGRLTDCSVADLRDDLYCKQCSALAGSARAQKLLLIWIGTASGVCH